MCPHVVYVCVMCMLINLDLTYLAYEVLTSANADVGNSVAVRSNSSTFRQSHMRDLPN